MCRNAARGSEQTCLQNQAFLLQGLPPSLHLVSVSLSGIKSLSLEQGVFKKMFDIRNQMHVPSYSPVPSATWQVYIRCPAARAFHSSNETFNPRGGFWVR